MKNRFLLMMAGLVGMASPSLAAFEAGDVVLTNTGACRVTTGENKLANGDFSNGLEGWTNLGGDPANGDTLKIYTDANSPEEGMPYLQIALNDGIKSTSFSLTANFRRSIALEEGATYLITYKAKLMNDGVSSNTRFSRNANYQDAYINRDGTCPYPVETEGNQVRGSIAEYTTFKAGEWQTVNYLYHADSTAYLNLEFFNLEQYDCFADFGVYEVVNCADSRYLEDAISTLESIINDTETFPGAVEYLADPLEELKSVNTPEALGDMDNESLLEMIEAIIGGNEGSALSEYLNTISADVSGYFSADYFNFDNATVKNANKGAAEGWTESGGRWGVGEAWTNIATNHIFAEIGANYGLGDGSEYISAQLPAGKYLYMVKGSAIQYYADGTGKNSNYYVPDYYTSRSGVGYFINGDSTEMKDISPVYAKTYYNLFDVAKAGEQTIGFYRKANSAWNKAADRNRVSGGGRVRYDNVTVRILGMTDDDINKFFLENTLAASQNALKVMIDSAKNVLNDKYDKRIYGKQTLTDSITVSQAIYDTYTEATQENIDIVDRQMPYMRDAIRAYYTKNEEYLTLAGTIAEATVLVADDSRPEGRATLQTALTTAEGVYNGMVAADVRSAADSTTLVNANDALADAIQEFYYDNSTYQSPGNVALVNADFTDGTNGWSVDGGSGTAAWKASDIDMDTYKGRAVVFNRGYTASDNKYIWQDVAITRTGVYEFFANCAVHNSKWNSKEGNNTSTYLFANKDSIPVITTGDGSGNQVIGEWERFSVTTTVTDLQSTTELENPGFMRVGLEKIPLAGTNVQVNIICFGSPVLYYYGSEEDYREGIYDVEVVDTTFDVYNLNGMKVRSNATSLNGLPKGIYIINGKKYVVK